MGRIIFKAGLSLLAIFFAGTALADECQDAVNAWRADHQAVLKRINDARGVSKQIAQAEEIFRGNIEKCTAAKSAGDEKKRVFYLGEVGAMWGQRANLIKYRAAMGQGILTALAKADRSVALPLSACPPNDKAPQFVESTRAAYAKDRANYSAGLEKDKQLIAKLGGPWSSVSHKVGCSTPGAGGSVKSAGSSEMGSIQVINTTEHTVQIVPLGRLKTGSFQVAAGKTVTIEKKKLLRTDGGNEHFMSTLVASGGGSWQGDPPVYRDQKVCTKRDFKRGGDDVWKILGGVAKGCSLH